MLNSVLDCKEKIVKKIEGYQLSNLSNPELFILKSLQSGEALYGIQIRNHIEACFKRRLNFSTLYPKLDLLLAQGLIEVEEREDNSPERPSGRRKYFKITGSGRAVLLEWESSYQSLGSYQYPKNPAY